MSAFERSVVIGGGAGAGFTLSMIEEFIQGLSPATQDVGGRKGMNVIIASQDPELRTWYVEALKEIEAKYARFEEKARITVAIHQTGPAAPASPTLEADEASKEANTSSANASSVSDPITSEMFSITFATGRPNLPAEIERVVGEAGVSSVGIVVCGPSSMSHDVATAAAAAQRQIIGGRTTVKDVFLHQESFS